MKTITRKVLALVCVLLLSFVSNVFAGFLDAFNKVQQTVQNTTNTIENAKRTAERAGAVIPKAKKEPAQKSAPVEVKSAGSMSAKDKAAIEKAKRAWVAAFKSEDWEALVDNYAENAVLLAPDEEAITGREGIRAYYGTDEDTSNEVFTTVSMGGDSNIVYVQGEFSFNIQAKGEPAVKAAGKYIEIWQKQPDGNWLITHDIFNASPAR